MTFVPIIVLVALVLVVAYILMNKKDVEQEPEGFVKDILNKDALVMEFDDGKPTIVKFHGISLAADNEMLDEKIMELLQGALLGMRVMVKPKRVGAGDIVVAEVHTLGGEYVNAVLLQQGFARWSPMEAASDQELSEAQALAKGQQLGIWNPAVRQLVADKMRNQAGAGLSDDEIANLAVNPEDLETKKTQES